MVTLIYGGRDKRKQGILEGYRKIRGQRDQSLSPDIATAGVLYKLTRQISWRTINELLYALHGKLESHIFMYIVHGIDMYMSFVYILKCISWCLRYRDNSLNFIPLLILCGKDKHMASTKFYNPTIPQPMKPTSRPPPVNELSLPALSSPPYSMYICPFASHWFHLTRSCTQHKRDNLSRTF